MRFELKLAWKYFRARRKSLARLTTVVAITGIAAGVASLILAQSLARGFADEMRDKILVNTAHISISMRDGGEIFNWKDIRNQLEQLENVEQIAPTVFENAVIVGKDSNNYGIIRVRAERNNSDGGMVERILLENPQINSDEKTPIDTKDIGISIGSELAEKCGLKKGDEAEIVTIENENVKNSKVRIADTFQTGLFEYDSTWISISPENYVKLKGKLRYQPTVLSISVKDIYISDKTAEEIRAMLGENFKIVDWQEANQPLFAALSLERKFSFAIISLIIFIAALNITASLTLLVNERKPDIAVLRTCGATSTKLMAMFLVEGLLLGFFGILFGLTLGISGAVLGSYFKIVSLPREVYSINYVPFHYEFTDVLLIILIAFFLCLAATIYPAFKASRVKPLDILRSQ